MLHMTRSAVGVTGFHYRPVRRLLRISVVTIGAGLTRRFAIEFTPKSLVTTRARERAIFNAGDTLRGLHPVKMNRVELYFPPSLLIVLRLPRCGHFRL